MMRHSAGRRQGRTAGLSSRFPTTLSIRGWLVLFAAVSLIPLLLALAYFVSTQYAQEKANAFLQLRSTSRALLQALDRELSAKAAVARSFATSRSIREGDFTRSHAQAIETMSTLGFTGAMFLADGDGRLILHTGRPFGSDLPARAGDLESIRQVFERGEPVFSNFFVGPVSGRPTVAVTVPVVIDQKVAYVLGLTIRLSELAEVLRQQQMPDGWLASIVDRNQVVLARSRNAEAFIGTRPNTLYADTVARIPEGTLEGIASAEGQRFLSAWIRSPISGWTLGIGRDVDELLTPTNRKMWWLASVAAASIVLSLLVAWIVGRELGRGTAVLQRAANAMREEQPVTREATRVREYDELVSAFANASALLRSRDEERARSDSDRDRLAALVAESHEFIGVADLEGRALFVNAAGRKLVGLSDESAVRGTSVIDYFAPEDQAFVQREVLPAVQTTGYWEGDLRFKNFATGELVPVHYNIFPVRDPSGSVVAYGTVTRDLTETKRQDERTQMLLNELNHRVKNSLTTVQSIATQTLRNNREIEPARQQIEQRLIALSKAHDILTKESWEGAPLARIVEETVAVHSGHGLNRFELQGPDVWMPPNHALALALALHELATNAVKYGALSNDTGRVIITWSVTGLDGTRRLTMRWAEIGGPPVSPPTRFGFGSRLVAQGLKHDLGGEVSIDFAAAGVVCTIEAPLLHAAPAPALSP